MRVYPQLRKSLLEVSDGPLLIITDLASREIVCVDPATCDEHAPIVDEITWL